MKVAYDIARPKASGTTIEIELTTGKAQIFALYYNDDGDLLKWSASFPLPQAGDHITITMNGIGPAVVVGFFEENGYVGVMTKATNPPKWLVDQRKRDKERQDWESKPKWYRDGIGCVFGVEVAL
jgi:hypothetical protein